MNRPSPTSEDVAPPAAIAAIPRIIVDAELAGEGIRAQIVRYFIPGPTDTVLAPSADYLINLCLTPRPPGSSGNYPARWGPHRFERLGDVFMIPPGERLRVRGDAGRQASLLVQLDAARIERLVGQPLRWDERRLAATLDLTGARIRSALSRITEEVRMPGLAAAAALEMLGGMLAIELGRHCVEIDESPVTGGLAPWRLRLIDERLAGDPATPSLGELAGLCGISVRQLTRGFRVSRGCSVRDYLEGRQMEAAKRLLMGGESVKGVAFAVGFGSAASFTFAFRRAVGVSPSVFRQRQARLQRSE